jgi:hypothetical protein
VKEFIAMEWHTVLIVAAALIAMVAIAATLFSKDE